MESAQDAAASSLGSRKTLPPRSVVRVSLRSRKAESALRWATPAIFFLTAILLLIVHGNRLVFTADEGFLLEPAQRMAEGARPYLDFFGHLSPGSYWLQALMFRLFGISLWTARLPVILDFSLQCALVYWVTARLASVRSAVAVLLMFAGFQIADPSFVTAQHRWDSVTLVFAGLCVGLEALRRGAAWWVGSGALLAAAAWCTPSVVLVVAAEAVWLAASRERRRALILFTAGVLAVTSLALGALIIEGCLRAFCQQMLWLKRNYSAACMMPYGSIIGGYKPLFEGAAGPEWVLRFFLVLCVALPALLPPLAVVLWGIAIWRGKISAGERDVVFLLLLGMGALVVAAFPRADMFHLALVAALPYGLAGSAAARLMPPRLNGFLACGTIALAALFALNYCSGWRAAGLVSTPIGTLRVNKGEIESVKGLLRDVRPGRSLFVYPYMPVFYFLTQAKNPTRFSFLAPGMMTRREESEALMALRAQPPEWVLHLELTREEFVRVFPSGSGLPERFEILEKWLKDNYRPPEGPVTSVVGYQLWRRASADGSVLSNKRTTERGGECF
ncbi:MAG TPA: glycosyltransferase family 39 protein [Bryobacteraceae bacterium]|nr:glycosyltransferase family 39 protein [Bryobacteraceae bacterium]